MGCATSKIDDLPAVALCRDRLTFLDQALHHRHSLSQSHLSYLHSLDSLSLSLNHFFTSAAAPAPTATAVVDASCSSSSAHLSHSSSGSHLHFHSDDDHLHDNEDSPFHENDAVQSRIMYESGPGPDPFIPYQYPAGDVHINYMKRHVTPSLSYQQRPPTADSAYNYYPSNPNYYANDYAGYVNYGPAEFQKPPPQETAPPPTPPPPPASPSPWDFLNLFETFETPYPPYTPSRDSREVREEEGIPDLEDVELEHEAVKEVHGNQKLVVDDADDDDDDDGDDGDGNGDDVVKTSEKGGPSNEVVVENGDGNEGEPVEYEVHMVDKKVVGEEEKGEIKGKKTGFRDVFEVVREIRVQFERASASGREVDKVLEVGKLRYHKNNAYQVSRKMLNVIKPSLPSSSKDAKASLDPDEAVQLRSVNLSASLQKLYLWEKKLFEEVKIEEKMRVLHDRKVQKLKHLIEKGAEQHKIVSTRSEARNLSTKITMAIQIVDRISVKINKVRDEELWPQLNELIQGLSRMWKIMFECHHCQCQAIEGARGLDAIAFPKNTTDTQLEASLQMEHDLINWTWRFTEWIGAQKGFVRALNGWLFKCLLPEPEVTDDGEAPFSPGRAGAPPVFVICHQWNQSLDNLAETSEKEVIDAMQRFALMIWRFRKRDKGEMRQRMAANRDMERKVKSLKGEDMKMQKEMQALDKKMALTSGASDGLPLSGNVVYQSDTSSKTSLQAGLLHIFEAMDRFTADSVKIYEELLQRTEEVVRERGRIS